MSRTSRLVGREHALAVTQAALDGALAGSGRLVLVSGEPGIGKSAVLAHLGVRAADHAHVLRGFCWEGAGAPPYWPWAQVLRQSGLLTAELGPARRVVEPTDRLHPDGPADAADAQFLLLESATSALRRLAQQHPLVVILDDLHWADEPSLQLLSFAARALAGDPVLLVGAYRDAEASAPLRRLATDAEHLPLSGLGPQEVSALVAAMPGPPIPDAVTAEVWRRSGGNPFFVQELARLVQAQGSGSLPRHLPATVIEAVRQRLARLSTDCVRLLQWAAAAGPDIDVALLVACGAAQEETVAGEWLGEARLAGVVTGTDAPRFAHDLYRDAILAGIPPRTLAATHQAIADALRAQERPGRDARIAAHLLQAGPPARRLAVTYCLRAAREASAHLGHSDACAHYQRALEVGVGDLPLTQVVLELAAAHARAGQSAAAQARFLQAADLARRDEDPEALARAALGLQALGQRSGSADSDAVRLLREAADRLAAGGDASASLRALVLAALARVLRHGTVSRPSDGVTEVARQAVQLARAAEDPLALATATLAHHDVMWAPGTAATRLPVVADLLAAATAADDPDLVAQAHLLRATALLELGDPAGRHELWTYIELADALGHARGRWGALTRRATYAAIAGRVEQAARLADEALELGQAIGEPDAVGCHETLRGALAPLGVPLSEHDLDRADPMWPLYPVLAALPAVAAGDLATARVRLGDFSVVDIPVWHDLEALAFAATVFAAVGSRQQRTWAYEQLLPHQGRHVVVGGCASYHAAVDHHLGVLAAALGDPEAARAHLCAALDQHHHLGAAGWARLSEEALARLGADNEFRWVDDHWLLAYAGAQASLPAAKGLHDLWMVLDSQGAEVHAQTLLGRPPEQLSTGADPVLDERARREYRARLRRIDEAMEDADARGDVPTSEALTAERAVVVRELTAAAGLGGRRRRLGDEAERARKTVGARVRDAVAKVERVHPLLAAHLRTSVRMGTTCAYLPPEPTSWRLR